MPGTTSISKILTRNDTGETGGHMAGIHVPKRGEILSFFPPLDKKFLNPRCQLTFIDDAGFFWLFNFIYYNNKFFGGTRNEYRLTGMTAFFRQYNLKSGDTVFLVRNEDGSGRIFFSKKETLRVAMGEVLKLKSSWQIISRY
ncbi:MAG: hypothetical protein GYA22_04220 [Bacteroidales bacterium]|nr:hypothetical protein [Bacteroidales bacterium]